MVPAYKGFLLTLSAAETTTAMACEFNVHPSRFVFRVISAHFSSLRLMISEILIKCTRTIHSTLGLWVL